MVDLCHSQLITKPKHKSGKFTLHLLFINIPELIDGVFVLGHKEACSTDNFEVNLDVSLWKTVKRKFFLNYAEADWRSLNFGRNTYLTRENYHGVFYRDWANYGRGKI